MNNLKDRFTSRMGFVFASAGSAIGLGALWEFPYMTGQAGGGAFFALFLIFTFSIGLPVLLSEYFIGRSTQKDALSSFKHYSPKKPWFLVGGWGVLGSIILLSFYSVVGGWIFVYILRTLTGGLHLLNEGKFAELFHSTSSNPWIVLTAQIVFLLTTVIVVSQGIKDGIEKVSKVLMPALLILLMIVVINSLRLDGASKGISYFLSFDFSSLTANSILMALGQSFFLLSVGFSNQITYSSYVPKEESLFKSATIVVFMNIAVAMLAGLSIFPAVFSFDIEPEVGPGLLFIALPAAFSHMTFGNFFLLLFMLLFLFAALTSAFPLLEVVVAAVTKEDPNIRKKWTWMIGLIVFIVGLPSALSFGLLSEIKIFGNTFFDNANFLVSNIMLPLGALFIALFIHFKIPKEILLSEFTTGLSHGKKLFAAWLLLIKYVVPIAIVLVFLHVIGLFSVFGL